MNVGKFRCHQGVDWVIEKALGTDLEILSSPLQNLDTGQRFNYARNFRELNSYKAEEISYDIFIIDDIQTWNLFRLYKIKAKRVVWYCHGTYHIDPEFQDFAKMHLRECPVIFPDNFKREHARRWMDWIPKSCLTLPPQLPESLFAHPKELENGLLGFCMFGNHIFPKAGLYGAETNFLAMVREAVAHGLRIYGENPERERPQSALGAEFLAPNHVLDTAEFATAVLFLANTPSMPFVLLEAMAAGAPIITTPKEFLPRWDGVFGKPYFIVETPSELASAMGMVKHKDVRLEVAHNAQNFLKQMPFEDYASRLTSWLASI